MARKLQVLFGQILRRRREDGGLTQEVLAHRAGLSRNYVGMLERGERALTIIALRQLAIALGTSMSSLIQELDQALDAQAGAKKRGKGS